MTPHTAFAPDHATVPGSGWQSHRQIQRPVPGVLDVVTVVSNPVRYDSRNTLYRAFERHMHASGARLTTVECAFGSRPFEVTEPGNPRHVQVRSDHELWLKESMIRLGISRLPADSQYVAWVDADVTFLRPDWVQEAIHQLQHYAVVQLFSEATDLGPDGHAMNVFRSFAFSHVHGIPRKRPAPAAPAPAPPAAPTDTRTVTATETQTLNGVTVRLTATTELDGLYYGGAGRPENADPRVAFYHHPGFAWAARRKALDTLGGLFDVAVVGESDYIMAKALVGEATDVLYPGVSYGYRKAVLDWQAKASRLRRNLGYVQGTLVHGFHGRKADRKYWDRCRLLTESKFDPSTDLRRDWQGLYQLVDHGDERSLVLRDGLRSYMRNRNEDATGL